MTQTRYSTVSLLALLTTAVLLSACGGGSSSTSGRANSKSRVSISADSQWTTLGMRATTSHPARTITTNADAEWTDYNRPAVYPKTASLPLQFITLRDGVELAVYVTLPADASGDPILAKTFPTILMQTPYNGRTASYAGSIGELIGAADPYMVRRGYASVTVDVRGTGQSGGTWRAFGSTEQADYAEVVKWVTQQAWSNGKIGVYGVSYLGITTILTAAQNHPAVKAAFAIVPAADTYRDILFTGDMPSPVFTPLFLTLVTGLGVVTPCVLSHPAQCLPTAVQHLTGALKFQLPLLLKGLTGGKKIAYDDPTPGSFWYTRSPVEEAGRIDVPTFLVGGLDDVFQRGVPLLYEQIKHHATTKLLIGPWDHVEAALGKGLPADGVPALNHILLRWFDQYLKGMDVGAGDVPNVTQYVRGYGHYVTTTDWPHPKASVRRLYLHGDDTLSRQEPTASEKPHMFVNSLVGGLCSRSTVQWTLGVVGFLPLPCLKHVNLPDRASVVYQTAPMNEAVYINGPIQANLWISVKAEEAVLSVRVSDVAPNGTARAVTNGVQLASLRAVDERRSRYLDGVMIQPWHPYTKASKKPLAPGKPTLLRVEIFPTSALIEEGHRLRVTISSSNTFQALPTLPDLLKSLVGLRTTIYNDAQHSSNIIIPVIPTSTLDQY